MGFEPMNTGFADQRVSHFAIGAHHRPRAIRLRSPRAGATKTINCRPNYLGCGAVRR